MKFLVLVLAISSVTNKASALPVENSTDVAKLQEIKHQLLNPSLNSVTGDEDEELVLKKAPITEDIFPDRQGFFSGHRIPFELFSQETIHELKNDEPENDGYVDASKFRQPKQETTEPTLGPHDQDVQPFPSLPFSSPLAFQPDALGQEFDRAYFATLDAFVHDF